MHKQTYTRVFGGMCVFCGCPSPLLSSHATAAKSREAGRFPVPAGCLWPCRGPCWGREGVRLHSLLLNYARRASAWGQRKSQVHWCYIMFFSSKCFFFSFLLPDLVYFFFYFFFQSWQRSFPLLLWQHETGQVWPWWGFEMEARFLSHCIALSQSGRGLFLAAASRPGSRGRARCHINRTLRLRTSSALRPVRGIFSKLSYCRFSFDVQSWAGAWLPFCSEELGRQRCYQSVRWISMQFC